MSFGIDDLTTPTTVEEAKASVYNVLSIIGVNTTNWRPGAVVRTIITAFAVLFAGCTNLIALIARSGFVALASGNWLTLVAQYVYGVTRIAATYATGTVRLTNAGGGVYTLNPGDLTVQNPTTGATYHNTSSVSVPALSFVDVVVQCDQQGSFGTSEALAITKIQAPSLAGVTCSNALALIGQDEEDDEALRLRCSEKLGSLSPNGPGDAYAYAARTAVRSDGNVVGVNRVQVYRVSGTGVYVYCATLTGAVTGSIGDLSTDLGAVDEAIQTQVVPIPIVATVASATEAVTPITYTVWLYNTAGLTAAQVQGYIAKALDAMFVALPIGGNSTDGGATGWLFKTAIEAAIGGATGAGGAKLPIFKILVSAPSADLGVLPGNVLVPGAYTGTVNFISPAGL